MCKSQTLFSPQWFQGQGCWQSHGHVLSSKPSLLPTTFPGEHHLLEMQGEKILRQPHSWMPWGLGSATRGLPTLPPLPPKATQSHQLLHGYLQLGTCLHNLNSVQILFLAPPGRASGAGAFKRHADSRHHPAAALTMDDRVWLSSERTQTPWPLLIESPPLPAVCTPRIPAGSLSFSYLHPRPHHPGPFHPHQQPWGCSPQGTIKFWSLSKANLDSSWGKLPSPLTSRVATPRRVPKNQTRSMLQPRFGLSTASTPWNPTLGRVWGTPGGEAAVRVQGHPWALIAPTNLTQEPQSGTPAQSPVVAEQLEKKVIRCNYGNKLNCQGSL